MKATVTLTMAEGTSEEKRFTFDGPVRVLVGRGDDCDIRLPNEFAYSDVSRHHCLFEIDPPHVSVRDLGSRNGTFVNGQIVGRRPSKLDAQHASAAPLEINLRNDDAVRVGLTFFRVLVDIRDEAANHEPELLHCI